MSGGAIIGAVVVLILAWLVAVIRSTDPRVSQVGGGLPPPHPTYLYEEVRRMKRFLFLLTLLVLAGWDGLGLLARLYGAHIR